MCLGCRQEQARQWAIRIVHESRCHDHAYFVTLTYDNASLPENGSLVPEDASKFVRRLRKEQRRIDDALGRKPRPISHYTVGEYGSLTHRPHYHSVLFGPDFFDRTIVRGSGASVVWKSELLDDLWARGITELAPISFGAAAYVAQYVRKKVGARANPDEYKRVDELTGELVDVAPVFSRMSLRPAIGKRWIEKWWRDVYPRDFVSVDGYESKPPRYYDKWMDSDHDGCEDCSEHKRVMMQVREKRYLEQKEEEASSLKAKEAHLKSRISLYQARNKV